MLKIARILIVALCCILICVLGTIYSFIRFKTQAMWALWLAGLAAYTLYLA